jgi:hypothetical protein
MDRETENAGWKSSWDNVQEDRRERQKNTWWLPARLHGVQEMRSNKSKVRTHDKICSWKTNSGWRATRQTRDPVLATFKNKYRPVYYSGTLKLHVKYPLCPYHGAESSSHSTGQKNSPHYETTTHSTVFTRARLRTPSLASWTQSEICSSRSVLVLSSHIRLGHSSHLLPLGLPTKIL